MLHSGRNAPHKHWQKSTLACMGRLCFAKKYFRGVWCCRDANYGYMHPAMAHFGVPVGFHWYTWRRYPFHTLVMLGSCCCCSWVSAGSSFTACCSSASTAGVSAATSPDISLLALLTASHTGRSDYSIEQRRSAVHANCAVGRDVGGFDSFN